MRRWIRRSRGGRLQSLGQDFEQGHRTYVQNLPPWSERWLRTKPFSAPPTFELHQCLHTFSHIVRRLELDFRAQVLDVGCGPGWLSEFLARCGYWVTGVDVSSDMVELARERVASIPGPIAEGVAPMAEFYDLPVREMPWRDRFDAAILYDAMHHFDDELETLRVIRRTLVPGGRIFIQEGVRPEAGSEAERNLIEEMKQFGTLESPFDPEYLVDVLEHAGFVDVVRLAEVDELFDLSDPARAQAVVTDRLSQPTMNTVVAANPIPVELQTGRFRAVIEPQGPWDISPDGRELILNVAVRNAGQSFWPYAKTLPSPHGVVMVAPYLDRDGGRVDLPRIPLPHGVPPGSATTVGVTVTRDDVAESAEIRIDLVREGIAWFADLGSSPLIVPLDLP